MIADEILTTRSNLYTILAFLNSLYIYKHIVYLAKSMYLEKSERHKEPNQLFS
jgi:hypothetical protein